MPPSPAAGSCWCRSRQNRPALDVRAQSVRPQRHRRAVRPPQTARPPRSPNARWRPWTRLPQRHITDPPNRRYGRSLPHRQRRTRTRYGALPQPARHLPQRYRSASKKSISTATSNTAPRTTWTSASTSSKRESLIMSVKEQCAVLQCTPRNT